MKRTALLPAIGLALLTACGSSRSAPGEPRPSPDPAPPLQEAPWQRPPLRAERVPAAFLEQWQRAANRSTCALLAPAGLGEQAGAATARAATFSGGWGVAYDLAELRSAFGVAGTGASAAAPAYAAWPYAMEWSDGSRAEYGPEGGTGPNQLAYLRIPGQGCLYNVWSRLGREHLESLLRQLRYVEGGR